MTKVRESRENTLSGLQESKKNAGRTGLKESIQNTSPPKFRQKKMNTSNMNVSQRGGFINSSLMKQMHIYI